jgi:hypothetical protein
MIIVSNSLLLFTSVRVIILSALKKAVTLDINFFLDEICVFEGGKNISTSIGQKMSLQRKFDITRSVHYN